MFRVGVDTGGTFTDLVALDEASGEVRLAKVFSTPEHPGDALLDALAEAGVALPDVGSLVHGTTVATNALLERKGARVAFVTTRGFEDIPFIQRIQRKYHYDLAWVKPDPLVEREHCFGAHERVDSRGAVITPLDPDSLAPVFQAIRAERVDAVALSYLFSYLAPDHELATLRRLQETFPDLPVSASCQLAPMWREYERSSTTIADAYLRPLMTRYLHDLHGRLASSGLTSEWFLMKSNGGMTPGLAASDSPINTIMSGPAGGMIAGQYFAHLTDDDRVITLDMGGTSCDIGLLVEGEQRYTTQFEIEWGVPINVPLIDVTSIGAGGGSIAWLDAGTLLRVGPQSAGVVPGPICYGRGGTRPTVTDANVVLGRVDPARFVPDYDENAHTRAAAGLQGVGAGLDLSVVDTALAIIEVANANMADAVKSLTIERGLDPRRFALMAFGGAGPLHATAIAKQLGIPRVLIPPHPGMFSALGMLLADLRIDRVVSFRATSDRVTSGELSARFQSLIAAAAAHLTREGFRGSPQIDTTMSMRYVGQNFEKDVSIQLEDLQEGRLARVFDRFHQHHQERYGYHIEDEIIEIVFLKVSVTGIATKPQIVNRRSSDRATPIDQRPVYFSGVGWTKCPVYRREGLPGSATLEGPVVLLEHGATTLVEPGQSLRSTDSGMLVIDL